MQRMKALHGLPHISKSYMRGAGIDLINRMPWSAGSKSQKIQPITAATDKCKVLGGGDESTVPLGKRWITAWIYPYLFISNISWKLAIYKTSHDIPDCGKSRMQWTETPHPLAWCIYTKMETDGKGSQHQRRNVGVYPKMRIS